MDLETLRLLEFDQVLEIIEGFAQSPAGKQRVRETAPGSDSAVVRDRLAAVEEASRFTDHNGGLRFDELEDTADILRALSQPTSVLEPHELLVVLAYLSSFQALKRNFLSDRWPVLASKLEGITVPGLLLQRIAASIDRNGEIQQSAYPELASIRKQYDQTRSAAQAHLDRFLKGAKAKFLIPDPFITQRAERYVIPVRLEHQSSIPGIVHGTSSSGATVFIEPFSAVELNNKQIYFRARETELVAKILKELTDLARQNRPEVKRIVACLAGIDFIFACAAFGRRYNCVHPDLNEERELSVRNARHLLLVKTLGEKQVVPISVSLKRESNALVISGPNTGGKTAALKTVGLLCAMAQSGFPVPAQEARLPLLKNILADIGDHQSITQQLSTFSAHIRRLEEIRQSNTLPSLLLLDEVGRGTDPSYGSALAIAVIEYFRRRDCLIMATTHHRAVKSFASSADGVTNASVCLDPITFRPTYRLEFGSAGSSSGLQIASQLGLAPDIVELARDLLDDTEVQIEKYLDQLREELGKLQTTRADFEEQLADLQLREREIRAEAAQREEQRQTEYLKNLDKWAKEFSSESSRYLKRVKDRFEAAKQKRELQLREQALKEEFRRKLARAKGSETAPPVPSAGELAEGDIVFHSFFQKRGTVVSVKQKEAIVEIEGKKVTATLGHLSKIETREVVKQPIRQVTVAVVEDTNPELNLVGMTVEEALEATDKFLDRAFVSQLKQIRIIHGFGKGRLKSSISQFLKEHSHVSDFSLEGGATRVNLKL